MRTAVTTLESYRLYSSNICYCKRDEECKCLEKLEASIKGEFKPTPKMEAGTKFHAAIETRDLTGFDVRSFTEALAQVQARDGNALQQMWAGQGVHEAKFTKLYGDVLVVGKWDFQVGLVATDWKSTDKEARDYSESLQWRFTLDALPELKWFRYESFKLKPKPKEEDIFLVEYLGGQEYSRYPRLAAECAEWVQKYREFLKIRGLEEFQADRDSDECPELVA
jgi:hypothetical protein